MRVQALSIVFVLFMMACCFIVGPAGFARAQNVLLSSPQSLSIRISVWELKSLIAERRPVYILDVRQPEEYQAGHIGNATSIPLDALPARVGELPREETIIVYCLTGSRSARAMMFLQSQGFKHLVGLDGGYAAWMNAR